MRVITVCAFLALFGVQTFSFAEERNIQIQKLSDGVWLHTSQYAYPGDVKFPSNGLIVKDGGELILVDTAWGELQTVNLLKAIQQEINLPVTKAVITHSHGDRAAGVDVLESSGVKVYAHPLTQRITKEHGLPVPNEIFDSLAEPESTIQFGRLQVFFPGPAHAMDNLMVWVPAEQILFGGCAIRAGSANSAGNTSHGDIESWLQVMDYIGNKYSSAEKIVPGHGDPGGIELIKHTSDLVKDSR